MNTRNDLAEVIDKLSSRDREAAESLLEASRWTEKQGRFVDVLVRRGRGEAAVPHTPPVTKLDETRGVSQINAIFQKARATGLRYPHITLETSGSDPIEIDLKPAGAASRYPGQVMVTGYRGSMYYGRIDGDTFVHGRDARPDVAELVTRMAADPSGVAGAYGRLTGRCCFCRKGLTDGRSVAVGYGPVCADHFGMPWGEVRINTNVSVTLEHNAPSSSSPTHQRKEKHEMAQKKTTTIAEQQQPAPEAKPTRKPATKKSTDVPTPESLVDAARADSPKKGRTKKHVAQPIESAAPVETKPVEAPKSSSRVGRVFRNTQRNYFLCIRESGEHDFYLSLHLGRVSVTRLDKADAEAELKPAPETDTREHLLDIFSTTTLDRTPIATRVMDLLKSGKPLDGLNLDKAPVQKAGEVIDPTALQNIIGEGAAKVAKKTRTKTSDDKPKPDRKEKAKGEPKPAKNPDLVPLKVICGKLDVDPKDARKILRSAKGIKREEGRWEFAKADVARVEKLIKEGIAAEA